MARDARLGPFDAPALAPMQRITSRESGRDTGQIRGPEFHPNLGCLGHVVIVHARLWIFARHVPRRIWQVLPLCTLHDSEHESAAGQLGLVCRFQMIS